MNIAIIIQARMGSTRLPGKTLRTVAGRPLLDYLLERVKAAELASQVVVATTTSPEDDAIAEACVRSKTPFYRGSQQDVLERYFEAAKVFHADAVVRITGDCPLIDPQVIDRVIAHYQAHWPRLDYVSNRLSPDAGFPRGMDVEIFSFHALEQAHNQAKAPPEREHVTLYFYEHPKQFALGSVKNTEDLSRHRWTVDTEEDFQLVSRLLATLAPHNPLFTIKDITAQIEQHPDWFLLNAHITQKPV
jgi:spore coat polysaccharide biosynthesis protein SpsF